MVAVGERNRERERAMEMDGIKCCVQYINIEQEAE